MDHAPLHQGRQERREEWVSIKIYRELIRVYVNFSYFISRPFPMIFFTGSSIISQFLLLAVIYELFKFSFTTFTVSILHVMIISIILQIITQTIGLVTYFWSLQPNMMLIVSFVGSCASFIISTFVVVISLIESKHSSQGMTILIISGLNTVMIYYTLWVLFGLGILVGMGIEAIIRAAICKLSVPYNTNIKLPFFFYPRGFSRNFYEDLQEALEYSKEKHGRVEECVLCLVEFKENEQISILDCHSTHLFHFYCLRQWKVKSYTCPM
eukprot:TRINITY_DN360_c0_g7_i1.p1 TRINITY_DN360_c0_g7~~TRINITY_DN360_c0_g7_i1.p1  ORF type:complete len:268 (+),score=15.81 TRINITY_DN360_c0_g7_i1:52-855(+)